MLSSSIFSFCRYCNSRILKYNKAGSLIKEFGSSSIATFGKKSYVYKIKQRLCITCGTAEQIAWVKNFPYIVIFLLLI